MVNVSTSLRVVTIELFNDAGAPEDVRDAAVDPRAVLTLEGPVFGSLRYCKITVNGGSNTVRGHLELRQDEVGTIVVALAQ